jgi:pimeloyl-ACP methyl ester carboxylesterase
MSIMAFAERHPDVFDARVAGVALVSTTAGGLKTHHVISRLIPDAVGVRIAPRVVAGLALAPQLVDRVRRRGSNIGFLVADEFAFGEDVPASYVEFVNNMLAETSFEVLAQFYPQFDTLDKFTALDEVARVPTYIISGTKDVMTSISHSRKMAARMPSATLVEVPGGGHMVIMEKKDRVNSALDDLFAIAADGEAPSQVS